MAAQLKKTPFQDVPEDTHNPRPTAGVDFVNNIAGAVISDGEDS